MEEVGRINFGPEKKEPQVMGRAIPVGTTIVDEKKLAKLEQDKKRLDWLAMGRSQESCEPVESGPIPEHGMALIEYQLEIISGWEGDPEKYRQAIDKAMENSDV